MTSVAMTRTISGLAPADDEGRAILRRIKPGQTVVVDIHRRRSNKSLARWWLLCQLIADNSEQIKSKEQASDVLKIMCGHCTSIVSKSTGEVYQIADSIAFSRLSEDEFQDVWRRAVKAVTEHILPGVTDAQIEVEILQLIGAASFR